jgi:hypothetical protein
VLELEPAIDDARPELHRIAGDEDHGLAVRELVAGIILAVLSFR